MTSASIREPGADPDEVAHSLDEWAALHGVALDPRSGEPWIVHPSSRRRRFFAEPAGRLSFGICAKGPVSFRPTLSKIGEGQLFIIGRRDQVEAHFHFGAPLQVFSHLRRWKFRPRHH